jgi:2-keto-3-deoxy-L-rhamnonate aldolase RhmA
MAPHIETREQAEAFVAACYFPPRGHRSWGGHRGTDFNDETLISRYGGRRQFSEFANENLLLYAQVESVKGYENLDEILAVDGLHAIGYGAFDLGNTMGLYGEGAGNPEIDRVQADMEKRARAAGKRLASDYFVDLGLIPALLSTGRSFVEKYESTAFPASSPAG